MTTPTTFSRTGAPASPRTGTPGRTILLVDDDADMRMYMRGCLRALKPCAVMEAANGREALERLKFVQPDLIITDMVMPGLDGEQLCRAIRDDPALSHIPILVISGQWTADSVAVIEHANAALEKPFNATILQAQVSRMLG